MHIENLESLYRTLTPVAWRRLKSFLRLVEVGQPKDYTTPFLPRKWQDHQQAFGQVMLEAIATTKIQPLQDIEVREADKFGPFSIRDPWELRREGVVEYFSQMEVKASISLKKAYLQMAKLIPAHSLKALSLDQSFDVAPKGKNLGLPEFTNDRGFEGEYLRRAKRIASGGYKKDAYPAVLGWRGQPNGSIHHIKNRPVWMMDHVESYISVGVIQVVLNVLRSKPGFAAWNDLSYVDRRITQILDRARAKIVSVDFSGYDRTLPETPIHLAFDLLRHWFQKQDQSRIDWMERQFLTVGIVTPGGTYTGRRGGVPSGHGATNFIDSLAQIMIALAAAMDIGYELIDIEVLGDDGVWSPDREIDLNAVSDYFQDLYGMSVSNDKGGFSRDQVQFLQRLHLRRFRVHGICVGIRSIMRTLNGICHLERRHRGLKPEFFSARAIMQLENAKNHPNFSKLVAYAYQHDHFLRDLDPSEIFLKAGGVYYVEDVLGLRAFRFSNELPSAGLDEFQTVKELRRLRRTKVRKGAA